MTKEKYTADRDDPTDGYYDHHEYEQARNHEKELKEIWGDYL